MCYFSSKSVQWNVIDEKWSLKLIGAKPLSSSSGSSSSTSDSNKEKNEENENTGKKIYFMQNMKYFQK